MNQTTLEQVIEAAHSSPRDDRRRLREWPQEQQCQEHLRQEAEKFRQAMKTKEERNGSTADTAFVHPR